MRIEAIDHDTLDIDKMSPSGLCLFCDQPVEAHDLGICEVRIHGTDYAYIAHASCIREAWEERDDGFPDDEDEES